MKSFSYQAGSKLMNWDRRVRHLRRWWFDVQDDFSKGVVALMVFMVCLATCALFWASFAAVESWLR